MTAPAFPGRLLGLDHGLKRIGVAVSDRSGLVARELTVITRKAKTDDFAALSRIAAEQSAVGWVIGLPVNRDLPDGVYSQADTVRKWIALFQTTTPLPIVPWEEAMSSVDALELARQQRRKPGQPIDDLAARVILQSYLDAVRDGLADPPPAKDAL